VAGIDAHLQREQLAEVIKGMRVVITGAAGRIGAQIVEELSPRHELRLIDISPVEGRNSIIADLSRYPVLSRWRRWFRLKPFLWTDAFEGAEAVVHLAANIHPLAPWEKVLLHNIQGTWNVITAAAKHRVPRIVFASSNWAVKALERKLAPDCYLPNGPKIGSDASPCPITPYGLSKAFGELVGRMFIDEQKFQSFVAVRIGFYDPILPVKDLNDEELRTRWIGTADIRSLFRRCVEAQIQGFHVVYGVSAQPTAPYDLSHTRHLLSWEPRQLP
jgi:NAD+ dependent glucose-6-phosphate dehydrogenase